MQYQVKYKWNNRKWIDLYKLENNVIYRYEIDDDSWNKVINVQYQSIVNYLSSMYRAERGYSNVKVIEG